MKSLRTSRRRDSVLPEMAREVAAEAVPVAEEALAAAVVLAEAEAALAVLVVLHELSYRSN
jgi:hypothetical protein